MKNKYGPTGTRGRTYAELGSTPRPRGSVFIFSNIICQISYQFRHLKK